MSDDRQTTAKRIATMIDGFINSYRDKPWVYYWKAVTEVAEVIAADIDSRATRIETLMGHRRELTEALHKARDERDLAVRELEQQIPEAQAWRNLMLWNESTSDKRDWKTAIRHCQTTVSSLRDAARKQKK